VALLVLVLHDGAVRQERLVLETPTTQEELSRLAARLNPLLDDAAAETVARHIAAATDMLAPNERIVLESLARMLEQLDLLAPDALYSDGIVQLLRRDEFARADSQRIRQVVEALERHRFVPVLAPQVLATDGVQVIIGGENSAEELKDMSVVVARYGAQDRHVSGLLGIVGPTRMQYGRAIAVVRYMTEMLSDLLSELYGPEQ
jgi:heat-inducible transcriptional repressor